MRNVHQLNEIWKLDSRWGKDCATYEDGAAIASGKRPIWGVIYSGNWLRCRAWVGREMRIAEDVVRG